MLRMQAAEQIPPESIERSVLTFYVKNDKGEEWYRVTFGNIDTFPMCACSDFQTNFLPCKHMFAVINVYRDMSWKNLPEWYCNLLYVTGPTTAEAKRTAMHQCIGRISNVLDELKASIFEGLSFEDLSAMEIGLNTIREQLPVHVRQGVETEGTLVVDGNNFRLIVDDSDAPPLKITRPVADDDQSQMPDKTLEHISQTLIPTTVDIKNIPKEVCLRPVKRKFTPYFPNLDADYNEEIIKNGPHCVSLLQVKGLEPSLDTKEKTLVYQVDKDFKIGVLHEEIVNSYLWCLCRRDSSLLYVPSYLLGILQQDEGVSDLWRDEPTLDNKRYIFMSWNPIGTDAVILLVVDVRRSSLYFMHPFENVDIESDPLAVEAKDFVSRMLVQKFNFVLSQVASVERTTKKCGAGEAILVCLYAKWLANEENLVQNINLDSYRKDIYDVIAGSCLIGTGRKIDCKLCEEQDVGDRVVCQRCTQQFHVGCVGLTADEAATLDYFVCP